ncbi:MAG: hypothetical protein RLZZ502_1865 [Pseudomonadota bacterium]|jgi:phosphoribosylanthranilate isomerase
MRTRIKLCGLRTSADIDNAVAAGADAIGFVLYPPSKRFLHITAAKTLRQQVPAFVATVVLMVNPQAQEVAEIIAQLKPDLLQFHGSESAEFCAQFHHPYLKAHAFSSAGNLLNFAADFTSASALLLDSPSQGHGGSGKTFPWQQLPPLANVPCPVVLSGGLTPQNVSDAIAQIQPYAVDVSSGIESSPGVKSAELMFEFCRAVQRADAS